MTKTKLANDLIERLEVCSPAERYSVVEAVLTEHWVVVPSKGDITWTVKDAGDPELTAIRALLILLERMDDRYRERAVRYALERFELEQPDHGS